MQTKFLIEESNMSSLVSTVPHVKLETNQADEAKEDDVGLVFKNDSDDDSSSDDE